MSEELKKDVKISVSGTVLDNGEKSEPMTFITDGRLYKKSGQYFLRYEESELTGLEGTRTTIKADADTVSVIRTGKYPSQMFFTVGEKRMALYDTGFGGLTVVVNTKKIDNALSDSGGRIDVLYEVEVENTPAYLNRLQVKVEEKRTNA